MSTWPSRICKRALVTGITGQNGPYLAKLLLAKGSDGARSYDVRRGDSHVTRRTVRQRVP